jgi:rare lipoprotein A
MKFENGAAAYATSLRWLGISLMCATVTACGTTHGPASAKRTHGKEYFSEAEYGVKASPRVASGNNIPKGGGRYMVGNPYQVKGEWYVPKEDFRYNKIGIASWYGSAFHGRLTANGEVYDQLSLSAAHPTFPLPSYARVTNVENGSSVVVRVNDRGPYHPGRIIDLSNKTADLLDLRDSGTGDVRVQYVGRAPLDGHDMPYLMASYVKKGDRFPSFNPQIATGVMVASNSRQISADQLPPSYTPTPTRQPKSLAPALAPVPTRNPMPMSSAAYAGSTPATQPANQLPPMTWSGGQPTAPFNIVLPEIGPIPYDRPDYLMGAATFSNGAGSLAMGYQEAEAKKAYVNPAFGAVMVRNNGLTQSSILAAYRRQHQSAIAVE